jgi:preprotein translocase subunit YajC
MLFISDAHAQSALTDPTGGLISFLPLILIFVVFYFMMIRPQMKQQKERKNMIESLKKGDEVVAGGGIVGRVAKIEDTFVTLEVSRAGNQTVELVVQRSGIASVLPHGTFKL